MKGKILIFLGLLFSLSVFSSCTAANKKTVKYKIQPDSATYSILGKTMTEVLFNPSKVTCYTVEGKEKVEKEDLEFDSHYVRDSLISKLDDEEISILQFLLLASSDNYKQDSMKVRSPYIPCIEFCFEKKKSEPVHIVISLSNYSWAIFFDDKRQGKWNYFDKKTIERYCRMIAGKALPKYR